MVVVDKNYIGDFNLWKKLFVNGNFFIFCFLKEVFLGERLGFLGVNFDEIVWNDCGGCCFWYCRCWCWCVCVCVNEDYLCWYEWWFDGKGLYELGVV